MRDVSRCRGSSAIQQLVALPNGQISVPPPVAHHVCPRCLQPFIMQLYALEPENVPAFARSYFLKTGPAKPKVTDAESKSAEAAPGRDVEEKSIPPVETVPVPSSTAAAPASPVTLAFADQHGVLVPRVCWVCWRR